MRRLHGKRILKYCGSLVYGPKQWLSYCVHIRLAWPRFSPSSPQNPATEGELPKAIRVAMLSFVESLEQPA